MATNEEILGKIQEILANALGVDDEEVTPSATLVGDLGAESNDFLDIVFNLEKEFDIKLNARDISTLENVGAMLELLKKLDV